MLQKEFDQHRSLRIKGQVLQIYLKAFDQMANCHTTGNSVRIDYDIGCYTFASGPFFNYLVKYINFTFLTVSTGEFVANLRYSHRTNSNFDEFVAVGVQCNHNLIDYTRFATS
uniref:Uncharacterized protein n=1 Tax=Romanomermis culicivorax TaxID=13658 RepID=A0A915IXN3_ROMCU